MSHRKNGTERSAAPDSLTSSGSVELSESALEQVTGGDAQTTTVNKAKTADKSYTQMDAYIRQ